MSKEKKKKKDSDEKEKKRKKKREKKALKEAAAAVVVSSSTTTTTTNNNSLPAPAPAPVASTTVIKIKQEPKDDEQTESTIQVTTAVEETKVPNESPKTLEDKQVEETGEKPKIEENEAATTTESDDKKPQEQKQQQQPNEATSLYAGVLDESEISTTCETKVSLVEEPTTTTSSPPVITDSTSSPKKEECLAAMPEPSKWERDDKPNGEDDDDEEKSATPERPSETNVNNNVLGENDEGKKLVTTEVIKRAENAIFQKAINAIRPIEIKKISESRKMLYQNPEPKVRFSFSMCFFFFGCRFLILYLCVTDT